MAHSTGRAGLVPWPIERVIGPAEGFHCARDGIGHQLRATRRIEIGPAPLMPTGRLGSKLVLGWKRDIHGASFYPRPFSGSSRSTSPHTRAEHRGIGEHPEAELVEIVVE
jgi:hypothetical protein